MTTKVEIKPDYNYMIKPHHVMAVVFICSFVMFILMSVCLMSSYWITAEGFRQGLLYLCIEETELNSRTHSELPLPFDLDKDKLEPGCYPNRDVGYLKVCTFFCLITQLSAMASACLVGLGARFRGLKRTRCLRFSICSTLVTFFCDITLIIVYTSQFAKEIDKSNREVWELNGAFGLACGVAILALGSLILLIFALRRTTSTYIDPTRV